MINLARKFRRISFRARLGTLSAIAVGLTVAMASLAAYLTVSHQLFSQVDSSLTSDASSLSFQSADDFLRRNPGYLVQYITPGQSTDVSFKPTAAQEAVARNAQGSNLSTINVDGSTYRVITVGGLNVATGAPTALQIARPIGDIGHTLDDLRFILWLVTLGGVAIAVALGWLVGKATLRPVERLTAAAEHIAATQRLDATIEEEGDDELARLAHAFNSMLTALASSRQQQAQLISDAGHELRTPLTSLRTNIEVLMRVHDLPESDRVELMTDVNAQLEELTTLIGDVVDMAREDEMKSEPIEVRLDSIVERAVERARRRAPSAVFDLHLTAGSVRTQPALMERAVLNTLDNAAKWGPPAGTVSVWLQRGACWTLDIRDEGPGIPADDLPHVFERFYRAKSSRSMPGSGLGLAIVKQVVTASGGVVRATCPPEGGTVIHIELPIVVEQELGADETVGLVHPVGAGPGHPGTDSGRSPAESDRAAEAPADHLDAHSRG